MRVSEYADGNSSPPSKSEAVRPPASFVAARLLNTMNAEKVPIAFVALSEGSASGIFEAVRCLAPDVEVILLPPWDCLPYDRVPPSRQCMGRRMDALRVWSEPCPGRRLLVTSLDAVLQRCPPREVIEASQFEVAVGTKFDRPGFEQFVKETGYVEDGLVDEPGEFAFRDEVIDIFPAGQQAPMRIVVKEDGSVAELRSYDPKTQRTVHSLESMTFGPASEAIDTTGHVVDDTAQAKATERGLMALYGDMPSIFDFLGEGTKILFAPGTEDRAEMYLDFIDEARQAHRDSSSGRVSLYLDRKEWRALGRGLAKLDLGGGAPAPSFLKSASPRKAFAEYVETEQTSGRTILLAGAAQLFDGLCRRVERDTPLTHIGSWMEVDQNKAGSLLRLNCGLENGFIDQRLNVVVIAVADVLGDGVHQTATTAFLAEPELQPGDVIVHEDHGIGILRGIERVDVEGVVDDAARLEYYGGASILVPMQEFDRLWRYGSEPQAVTLDRLHTDGWSKKREVIAKDIRRAARHLLRLAKERGDAKAEVFVPPAPSFSKFLARFPYALTIDQRAAIKAVLDDLGSGKVMNRLICGDVGFGKTEIALRATAAVALSGAQVAIVVPTTVLARQHFVGFERRFAGTGIGVAMLSRVVDAKEVKRVKAGLASGDIQVVVATHAVLAKDIAFARLGLLVIDEEHRFGTSDKAAMKALAPRLHTLTMSATPIPRTLQAAMVGVQDVSLLATPPSKRRPVRISSATFDAPSMRVALLREHRRGGQSFVVAPQIDDLDRLETILRDIVPELAIQVAHGKMAAAAMDKVMVDFADGQGDVLLSTNIIESGLDVPRANTIFVWRADRFGLAQLHQLRGRVGRGRIQGIAYLLTSEEDDISDETRLRLAAIVDNDRLGAGLALSVQDLDLRGGGDIIGEDQAGHMKVIGVSLYQRLLERAVMSAGKRPRLQTADVTVNLGVTGMIPDDYVPDASVRLSLYAKLLRATSISTVDALSEELVDRFGDIPYAVTTLLRLQKLRIKAAQFGITKIDAGPRAMALTFETKPTLGVVGHLSSGRHAKLGEGRLIYEQLPGKNLDAVGFFERVFHDAGLKQQRNVPKTRL